MSEPKSIHSGSLRNHSKKNYRPVVPLVGHQDTKVNVALVYDDEDPEKKVYIEVRVRSNARSKPKAEYWSSSKFLADEPRPQYLVEKHAEALASYQCETFGDVHDPQTCAKAARAALYDLKSKADKKITTSG